MRIRVPKLRHRLHSIRARTALLFDLAVASSVALAAAIARAPSVAVLRWQAGAVRLREESEESATRSIVESLDFAPRFAIGS
jgi:hypothetical protein